MNLVPTLRTRLIAVFRNALLTSLLLLTAASASAQVFTEDFSYAPATPLNGTGGWSAHSGAGTNPPTVTTPGLSYTNYAGSGVGNKLSFTSSAEDNNHSFAGITSGSVYAAAMVNLSATQTAGDYFFHMVDGPIAGNAFRARLFAKKDASTTNYALGIQSSSNVGSLVYTGFTFTPGTTYFVVVKYTFVAGATNDQIALFINPVVGAPEPAPTLTTVTTTGEADVSAAGVAGVAIRQGNAANAATGSIDGIRVGTSWATSVGPTYPVHNLNTNLYYQTIQPALSDPLTLGGHTIHVDPGTYTEQVEVTKSVTLTGDGCANTIIKSPVSLPLSFLVGVNPNKPVVYVHDTGNAVIQNLTVDGDSQGNANNRFIGIAYYNAGGKVANACVVRVQDNPFSGVQHGTGVYANNSTGGPYALELDNVRVSDFQKNGLTLNGAGLTINVHGCTVIGKGYTAVTAQNGIQVSGGTAGTVSNSAISDLGYTPATFAASGLLTFAAGTVNVSGLNGANKITNVQSPINWYDTNGSMDGIEVSGGADFGPIFVYNSNTTAAIRTNGKSRPAASPMEDAATVAVRPGDRTLASFSATVTNSCLTGTDVAGTVGVFAYTEGGPLAVDANHNEIHDWDYGFATYGAAATLTANLNSISSNPTAGYDNTGSGSSQNAENNWWGAANGPSGAGPGSGDAILGSNVDFTPFATTGADATPGCAFTPMGPVKNLNTGLTYFTIQSALDDPLTLNGHTIQADPGTYTEQVEVTKSVTITGGGCANTIIKSPAVLPLSFLIGVNPNKPVVYVHDTGNAVIQNLTVDGDDQGNANYRFIGIAYYNGGGKVANVCVVKIEESPFSGTQHGVGVYANNTTGGPYALELDNVRVTDFQKTGIALNGTGLTVNVHNCTTIGKGPTVLNAQNGIQVSFGAGGTVANCAISELSYTPATFAASGLLTFGAATVNASGLNGANAITNVQSPINWYDTNGSMDGIEVSGGADFGPIFVYNSSTTAAIRSNGRARPAAAPFGEVATVAVRPGERTLASYSATVTNSCLNGTDVAGTVGIYAYTEGGPLAVDANHNEVHDWDYGFATYGATATLTANLNSISSNPTAGYDNTGSGSAQDAEDNWWGAANGPSGAGPGSGDAVLGANVDFTPFLHSNAEGSVACGFSPLPEISINDVTLAEGNVGPTTFTFTVTLSRTSPDPTSVDWQVNDGTALLSNNDYVDGSGTLIIPGNTLSGIITVDVNGDLTLESNETFTVDLSNPVNGSIADGQGVGTIQNDDGVPTISISDVTLAEGDAGFTNFVFDVTLSNASDQSISVTYQTADNSAFAPGDYLAAGPTVLTFPPKTLLAQITIQVVGDVVPESDETFFVNLSNPSGAAISDGQGIGTIMDDEVTAVLLALFETATVSEGIELRWQFTDASDIRSTWIERAPALSGPWTRIVPEASVRNGITVALDRTAEAGRTYAYRLVAEVAGGRQVTFTPTEGTAGELVKEFALARVSPNPTTEFARIEYTVAREAKVRVSIVDLQGRTVTDVVNAVQRPGRYQAVWNGEGARGRMPAGVYFVRFEAGGKSGVKRIMLTH